MVQSDALSRQQDFVTEEDSDNENLTLLPESMFIRTIDTKLQDLFAESLMGDDLIADAIKMIKEGRTPPMRSSVSDWEIEEGLLFF